MTHPINKKTSFRTSWDFDFLSTERLVNLPLEKKPSLLLLRATQNSPNCSKLSASIVRSECFSTPSSKPLSTTTDVCDVCSTRPVLKPSAGVVPATPSGVGPTCKTFPQGMRSDTMTNKTFSYEEWDALLQQAVENIQFLAR